MKRKILWLGVSWLIVAALVLASCGPTVPGEEEEEEEEEEIPTFSIGETYQTPEIAVTVSEAIVTDSYEYYHQASESMRTKEASPGTSFLIITVELNNVGSQTKRMEGALRFRAIDSEDSQYQHASLFHGDDRLPYIPSLRSGEEMRGTMLFNIPEGASGLKIGYGIYVSYGPNIPLALWEIE